jgi:hypothetical protein
LIDATRAVELVQDQDNRIEMTQVSLASPVSVRFHRTDNAPFRVTVVWADSQGPIEMGNGKSLVNDVDATLRSPSGKQWLPYVLSATAPYLATQAVNHVDNVEVIDVNAGSVGDWTLGLGLFATTLRGAVTQAVATIVPNQTAPISPGR